MKGLKTGGWQQMPIQGGRQRCRQCGFDKPLGEFRAMERLPRKVVGTCKDCECLTRRERRKMVKERERRVATL